MKKDYLIHKISVNRLILFTMLIALVPVALYSCKDTLEKKGKEYHVAKFRQQPNLLNRVTQSQFMKEFTMNV